MLNKSKKIFQKYITLGINENTTKNDVKKIQLLHIFCNTWHLISILTCIEDYFTGKMNLFIGFSYAIMFSLVVTVQVCLYLKKNQQAGYLFIFNHFIVILFFSNFIYKGELLEYFFFVTSSVALIFIDNKKTNIIIHIISLCGLCIPNLYFKHYNVSVLNNLNPPLLFFSLFIIISYFKNLNLRNEKNLEGKTKELEELDKFKSQFFTNISHEIRTPLTLINGYISDLELNTVENKKKEEKLKKQIYKITNIVDSVLDLAKMQSSNFKLDFKSTNISELIRKTQMNFEPLFNQKKIKLQVTQQSIDYFSLVDVIYIEKALNNLIVNALKYTDNGAVSIDLKKRNQWLIINVSDTGIGISNENMKNIFNRFYQVHNDINTSSGSGIGLAFCKEIIELHNGSISLESKINKGSNFTITLPLEKSLPYYVQHQEKKLTEDIYENIILNNTETQFLIVDDNYDMRKYLTSILGSNSYLEASNGEEALAIINTKKIDFIITDYMMPKLNGYELVSQLNLTNNNIPIIMLTAKTDIDAKLDVLKLGINDYLTKPFNKNELLTRINNCIANNTRKKVFNKKNNIDDQECLDDDFITSLKAFILKNMNNKRLHQDTIADEFNISKSSFYRKVKSNTGLNPNNFIKEVKLQKARKIILETPLISLKELSYEVGFSHTSYFSKVYKERFGIKPLDKKTPII